MKKDIKDYLHLYLGQKCKVQNHSGEHILVGIKNNAALFPYINGIVTMQEVKPLLRPLSDMTKEEAMLYVKILDEYAYRVFLKDGQIQFDYHKGDEIGSGCFDLMYSCPEQFLYLLKQRFDLFNLISEGLALDKTKMK